MPDTLRLHVQRVKDGDTLVLSDADGDRLEVRLWGVDCPETSQPYGRAAEKVAREVAQGELVTVEVRDTDPYGRLVGRVQANGNDLARTLAYHGLAWHSRRYPTSSRLKELERSARADDRGLWSQDTPTPPWEHRGGRPMLSASELGGSIAAFLAGGLGLVAVGTIAAGYVGTGLLCGSLAALLFYAAKQAGK